MKLGIRAHDLGKGSILEIAQLANNEGISYLQLVLSKAILHDDGLLNEAKAQTIRDIFHEKHVQVAMLGAYFNPVHSHQDIVNKGLEKFKNHLKYASQLDCLYVGTETGSYNDDSWTYHPMNRSEEAYQRVLGTFLELCHYAQDYPTFVACEGAYGHVIHSPICLKRLYDDVNQKYPGKMKVIIDLYNYLSIDNHQDHVQIFKQAIKLFKDQIVIFHLKDYILEQGKLRQVCIGKGLIDYPTILKIMKNDCPNAILILEGIIGEDIRESIKYLNNTIKEDENGGQ